MLHPKHFLSALSLFLFILFTPFFAQAQTQIGGDIDGEALSDLSGYSVSMPDAYTVAIGATSNSGGGSEAGHVRVYSWDGSAWSQKGADIDGEALGDNSGWSVSMPDANTVAIGAPSNDGGGSAAGHVRVYSWDGSAWSQKGADIDGEVFSNQSGFSVSMPDANTVAIGAPFNNDGGNFAGHVRVYSWDGSAWSQKGADIDGETAGDQSGFSVSMPDANTVAIGATSNSGGGSAAGHVRVYSWDGSAWSQKGADIDGETTGDQSGYSVSMPDANTVAIGATNNDGGGSAAGHVRVYSWDGSAWSQKGADIDGEALLDQSGYSVSMPDINTVAIGAIGNDGGGSNAGHVRVYSWDGSAWSQKGADIDGEAASDFSGWSVSMPDAYTVAIGVPFHQVGGNFAGHVGVFSLAPPCTPTASSVTLSDCAPVVSPSGLYTWTTSGTYRDTIPNAGGCDSVITYNLTILSSSPAFALYMNAGGPAYTATNGDMFVPDMFFNTGADTYSMNRPIANTNDQTLFKSERFDDNLAYAIPVPFADTFYVSLYFAEIFNKRHAPNERVFDILLEGQLVLDDYDIYVDAGGGDTAVIKMFKIFVNDDTLNLSSVAGIDKPKINALSIVSATDTGACAPCLVTTASSCLTCPTMPTYGTTLPDPILIGTGLSNTNMAVMEACGLNVGIKAHKRFLGDIIPTGNTYQVEIGESPVSGSDPTPDPGTARWNFLASVNLGTYTFNDLLVYQKIDFDPADGPGQTMPYVGNISQFMIDNGQGATSFFQSSENIGFGFWQGIGDPNILPFDPFATGVYDQSIEVWTLDSVLLLSTDMRVEAFKLGCTAVGNLNYDPTATVDDGSCDTCFVFANDLCTSCPVAPSYNDTLPDLILIGSGISNRHMAVMEACGLNVGIKAHKRFTGDITPNGNTYQVEIGESPVSSSDPTPDPGTARWNYLASVNLGAYTFNDLLVYQKIDFDPADGSGQTAPYLADISQFMIANSLGATSLYQESQNLGFGFWQTIGDPSILAFDPFATGVYEQSIEVWTLDSILLLQTDMRVEVVKSGCTDPLASNYDPTATSDDGSCASCFTVNTFDDPINSVLPQTPGAWYTDRYEPATFMTASFMGEPRLQHSLNAAGGTNNRPSNFSSNFYDTQGKKFDFAAGATGVLQIDLYVPSAWSTTGRRMAGLWGTAFDASDVISAFPIIEFTSTDGNPRFRGWNGAGWDDLGLPCDFAYDTWNTLRIELLPSGEFRYSVNDLVYTTSTMASTASAYIGNIILQGHNTAAGVDYDIYWDNLLIGQPIDLQYNNTLPDPIAIGSGISNTNMATAEFCNINAGIKAFKRFLGDVVPVDGDRPGDTYQFGTGVSPTDASNTTPDPGTARWNYLFSVNLGSLTFSDVKVYLDIDFDPSDDACSQTGPFVADVSQTLIDSGFGGLSFFQSSQNIGFPFWQALGSSDILPFDPYADGVYDLNLRVESLNGVALMSIPIRVAVGCDFIDASENLEVAAISCPADITVYKPMSSDPWQTGMASLTDGCSNNLTYSDDRSGLDQCNSTGVILRKFIYDNGVQKDSCVQTITVVDTTAPVLSACAADTNLMSCSATLNFETPLATDLGYEQDFEDPAFMADNSGSLQYLGWNAYTSHVLRANSGDNGITSFSGSAHAVIDTSTSSSFTGAFSRLGGYSSNFGDGFVVQNSIYIDLSAPGVASNTYGWDLSVAASRQNGNHLRDFIFHAASDANGNVLIGGSNNTNFSRRNDLASINHHSISTSGWYTFEWNFRDSAGALAVDLILRDNAGTFLWKETRYTAADLIASVVGGNRYMWFNFLDVEKLAIDNIKVIRNLSVTCSSNSGDSFPVGVNSVSCVASDDCGNSASCSFDVTVLDMIAPQATCKDTVLYLDANGNAVLNAEDLDGGSTDECSSNLTFSASQTTFSCDDLPTVEVMLYVTDLGGNIDSCTATVIVLDTLDAEYDGDTLNNGDCTDCFVKVPFDNALSLAASETPGTWFVDRYAPDFFGVENFMGDNRLKHSIIATDGSNTRPASFSSAFYNTQGRQYELPYSNAGVLAIDLYVPSSWSTSGRRMAGLWGIGYDASEGISAYPIIEFTSSDNEARFRGYDGDGTWIDMGLPCDFAYDQWYTLRIELLPNGEYRYSVGDQVVTTKAHGTNGSVRIGKTILQGHNNDVGVTYDIYWDNLVYGQGLNLNYDNTLPDPIAIGSGISNQHMAVGEYCGLNGGIKAFKRFLGDVVPVDGDRPGDTYQFGTGVSPTDASNTTPDPGTARWNFLVSVNLGNLTFNDVKVYLDIDFDPADDQCSQTGPYVADISQFMIDNSLGGTSIYQASQNLGFAFWQTIGDPNILPFDPYATGIYDLALRVEALDGMQLMYIPIQAEVGCEFIDPLDVLEPITLTCPADISVYKPMSTDPWLTGMATLSDGCTENLSFSDDRSGLNLCDMTGVVVRTFTYDDGVNTSTCVQNITVIDTTAPVLTACPADIVVDALSPNCVAAVNFDEPTATDLEYYQGFEDPSFMADNSGSLSNQGWNAYTSMVSRLNSGDLGVSSASGAAHANINKSKTGFTGAFSRLGGYSSNFGDGFNAMIDIYIDLSDTGVAGDSYGWDLSTAASRQNGSHLRDFIFHAASDANGNVLIGGSNNSNFTRRNDIATLNHYSISTTGWYTFEWNFRDSLGSLAVDLILRDNAGTFLWKETRYTAADLIATVVGGNRYMWFTFAEVENLAIDNVKLIRPLPVSCTAASGDLFAVGTTTVQCTAIDSCGNINQCSFDVTVQDITNPTAVCQNIVVYLDQTGTANITPQDLDGGSSDDCSSNIIFSASQTVFTCVDLGLNSVELSVTDESGNTRSCISEVEVRDTISPVPVPLEICSNDSVFLEGAWQNTAGIYCDTLITGAGCDSVVCTDLSFKPAVTALVNDSICAGDSLFLAGAWQTEPGFYSDTLQTSDGCDSVLVTILKLQEQPVFEKHINSGSQGAYTSVDGTVFMPDIYFTTPSLTSTPFFGGGIANTLDDGLYNSARYGSQTFGDLGYNIPVSIIDTFYVTIYVAETFWSQPAQREYDIIAEGITFVQDLDPIVEAGGNNIAIPQSFKVYVDDGELNILGDASINTPEWAGISVVSKSRTSTCTPVCVNTSDTVLTAICNGDSLFAGGAWQTTSGVYCDTVVTAAGCDSVTCTNLSVGQLEIVSMDLVESPSGNLISTLSNGYVINKALLGTDFSILAIACSDVVGSVVFSVNGSNFRTENVAPYAIRGDNPQGVIRAWNPAVGFYTITATPYSNGNGNGTMGTPLTYNIQVIDQLLVTDCNGDLGGGAFFNDCNECVGGFTGKPADFGKDDCGICGGNNASKDCNGECGGTAVIDSCGECVLGSTGLTFNNSCSIDCNGDLNGTAVLDDCGVCSGGNTGVVFNENQDCNGECFGTAVIDDCNECVLGSTGLAFNATCADCNGDPNGTAVLDDCGICSGGLTGVVANADKDSCGVCFGNGLSCAPCQPIQVSDLVLVDASSNVDIVSLTNNYMIVKSVVGPFSVRADVCFPDSVESVRFFLNGALEQNENLEPYAINGDNNGNYKNWNVAAGTYTLKAVPYSGNNGTGTVGTDLELTIIIVDNAPVADCNGDVGGSAVLNDCGICVGGNTGLTPDAGKDDCGVCNGNNADKDCAGVCFGSAVIDDCNECVLGTTGKPFNGGCDIDCNGDINGTATLDDCNVCSGGNTGVIANSAKDTCGVCFGNNLSCAPCQPNEVTALTLMNVGAGGPIRTLNPIDTVIKSQVGSFSVRADVCDDATVSSVRFFSGLNRIKNENIAPYAINGDKGGSFNPWNVAAGFYQITATPYTLNNGQGLTGISKTIDLWIFDTDPNAGVRTQGSGSDPVDANAGNKTDGNGGNGAQDEPNTGGATPNLVDNEALIFRVFPNPTSALVNVELVNVVEPASIMLIDASGKVLAERNLQVDQGYATEEFDLSNYPEGIYLIKLYSGEELKTQRVVRQ